MKVKKFNKAISLLLCASMCAFAGGIMKVQVNAEEKSSASPYVHQNEFLIGSWISFYDVEIASYEQQLEDMAISGVNYQILPNFFSASTAGVANPEFPMNRIEEFDALYKKYNSYYNAHTSSYANTPEQMVEAITSANADNCIAYHMKDEPSSTEIPTYAQMTKDYTALDPTRVPYLNLYPNYAGSAALGGSYETYVRNWVNSCGAENLPLLSFDHYPFTGAESVRATYFSDVETIRKVAFEAGRMDTAGFTQMGSWNGMRRPTPEEARWSVNSLLAYGFKTIQHFCWTAPAYTAPEQGGEGMLDFVLTSNGEKTDLYEPMQIVNWQTRQIGNELLLGIDCAHAYHTANVPTGAEALPKNFVVAPTDKSSDFIISVFTNKDDSQKYIALFNKSLDASVTAEFKVDAISGIESMTKYVVDDFQTLPDYTKALPETTKEEVTFTNGTFTEMFEAGEIKFFKLNGENVDIPEELVAPTLSLENGTYCGEQTVYLSTAQKNADVYYTLDGSFPDPKSATTFLAKDGKVTFGKAGDNKYYPLRAICVRGEEISKVVTGEYYISDRSENIALNAPVSFYNKDFTETMQAYNDQGTSKGREATDGAHNPFAEVYVKGEGWAVVDLGSVQSIDKIITSFWNNWTFKNVIVQLSETADFANPTTVYNSNKADSAEYDNTLPSGSSPDWVDTFGKGKTISFAPVNARYVRVYNVGTGAGGLNGFSVWQEIEVFNHVEFNDHSLLNTSTDDWMISGGGNWSIDSEKVSIAPSSSASEHWNRSYVYTGKTYKNFILEGTFTITNVNGSFVGFGLYKNDPSEVVGSKNGFYAMIENGGRVATYNNNTEFGPRNIIAAGFDPSAPFTFRVVSVGEFLSISVNGKSVYTIRDSRCDKEAGYISVLAASNTIEVRNLWIMEVEDTGILEAVLYEQANDDKLAVEKYTDKATVLSMLPESVTVKDTNGKKVDVPVASWHCYDYNSAVSGYYTFVGKIDESYGGANPYGVAPQVRVFVRSEIDLTDLIYYYDIAKSLNKMEYTPQSWEQVEIYMEMAEDVMEDKFLAQSDIGVAIMRLYNALEGLETVKENKTDLNELIVAYEKVDASKYLAYSVADLEKALAEARAVVDLAYASEEQISKATYALKAAKQALVVKGDVSLITAAIEKATAALTEDKTAVSKAALQAKIDEANKIAALDEVSKDVVDEVVEGLEAAMDALSDIPQADTPVVDDTPASDEEEQQGCASSAMGAGIACATLLAGAAVAVKKRKED